MRLFYKLSILLVCAGNAFAQTGGFNLSESEGYIYDASTDVTQKTDAQKAVDQIKSIGGKHVVLNVRGTMTTGKGTEILAVTPPAERSLEARRIVRLAKYIRSLGMTIGVRPIFFVVGPNKEFPYIEVQPDGTRKQWWHGNIQPSDPNRWFESFRVFLDQYITVAQAIKADEFTIGAELYSMTVGIEDQWTAYPYGFPGRWLELLRYVRGKLPNSKLMYDINFTDDKNIEGGLALSGGELERWRYRLVDLANPHNEEEKIIWEDLKQFWKELDAIGIDMYRSLSSKNQIIPTDYKALVDLLKQRTDSFATQLDNTLNQISLSLEVDKPIIFKEVGYRSTERGFEDPFNYASNSGRLNIVHQAAAYDAFFQSFWAPRWPWFGGVIFWDVQVNPNLSGSTDKGFSPIGKANTEEIIKNYF